MIYEVPCGMRNACRIYLDYLYSNCNQVSPALKDQQKKLTANKNTEYTCLNTVAETYKNGELINKLMESLG